MIKVVYIIKRKPLRCVTHVYYSNVVSCQSCVITLLHILGGKQLAMYLSYLLLGKIVCFREHCVS